MKKLFTLSMVAGCVGLAVAQEAIPQEQLGKVAPRLAERASGQQDAPFHAEVDAAGSFGMKVKEYGAVVIPVKTLTKEALAKAGAEVVPIGHLWLRRLVPVVGGARVAAHHLRPVLMDIEDKEHTLQLLYLGAQKKEGGDLALVIFGIGKEPVAILPMKKTGRDQSAPLELEMRKGGESLGVIDLRILGEYEASLAVEEGQP